MEDPWITLAFTREDKQKFHDRRWRVIASRYPMLFDEQDRTKAIKQAARGYYFFEWTTAVHIYEKLGLRSLFGQYASLSHVGKQKIFERIAPTDVVDTLRERTKFGRTLGPDLFVYKDDGSDWFFVEAKSPRDTLREPQRRLFARLEQASGRHIRVVRFQRRVSSDAGSVGRSA